MGRFIVLLVIAVALECAAAGAAETGALSNRIVFAATAAPNADDVMLVRADGSRRDLSSSAAPDSEPVLSPDGKLVAFFSTRGGHGAEYVVAVDGRGLRAVTPAIATAPAVAWSPDSATLAVLTGVGAGHAAIHRASTRGGLWQLLDSSDQPSALVGWSPGGKRVAYVNAIGGVEVRTAAGRRLLDLVGTDARWSPAGRLAVQRDSESWRVYDPRGRQVSAFAATKVDWSRGDRLASIAANGVLQLRLHGAGRPSVSVHVGRAEDVRWLDATRLRLLGPNAWFGYDATRRVTFALPVAYRWLPAGAASGREAFGERPYGTLQRSTLAGATTTVATVPSCQGKDRDGFAYLQALPDGTGAVYASTCAPPNDLFAVTPDGTALARITATAEDEHSPALSPDGSRIAFTRLQAADCEGCDETLWQIDADGSGGRAFPLGGGKDRGILRNDHPSFSPDGATILFDRWDSAVSDQAALFEIPAAGGVARALQLTGSSPAWGATRIAFDENGTIKTAAPNGSDLRAVAGARPDGLPAWSPDGRLAILESIPPSLSIFIPSIGKRIALPGLRVTPDLPSGLAWSPDGSRFAFTAVDADGVGDVWTIGVDGSGLTRVTRNLGASGALSWR